MTIPTVSLKKKQSAENMQVSPAVAGGCELNKNVSGVTSGLFSKGFEGSVRNVYLYGYIKPVAFKNSEAFNVYEGSE